MTSRCALSIAKCSSGREIGKKFSSEATMTIYFHVEQRDFSIVNTAQTCLFQSKPIYDWTSKKRDGVELIAFSQRSKVGQGAVLLGTKWRLLHFVVQTYDGKCCIADFKDLIANGAERMKQNVATEKIAMIQGDSNEDEMLTEFG